MAIEPEEEHPHLDEDEGGPIKSFLEHLEDLRWVLIKSISTVGVAMLICLIGGNYVVAVLKRPLEKAQVAFGSEEHVAVLRYGTNRIGTYNLDLDQWNSLNAGTNKAATRLFTNDIIHLKPLAARLESPDRSDLVSQFVKSNLSNPTLESLTNYNAKVRGSWLDRIKETFKPSTESENVPEAAGLRTSLVEDFNRIITSGPIYTEERFSHVPLSLETSDEIKLNLTGLDLQRFNRRLLLHAYRSDVAINPSRFIAYQLDPKSDGEGIILRLRPDRSGDAESLARHVNVDLNTMSPAGGFYIAFQVAVYAGIALSSPLLFYFICQFIFPALKWKEKKYVFRGLFFFIPLFMIGASFCYFILMPVALAASQAYPKWLGVSANIWAAEEYFSFVSKFILGMGLGFEMPVIILVLVKIGLLNYAILSKGRRYMIVINLVLGALLTTPEVLTQVLMAIPLQVLYEISVWIAWYWERQEKKRQDAEAGVIDAD